MKKKKILDLVQNWWVSWDVSGQGKEPLLKKKFKKRQRRGGGFGKVTQYVKVLATMPDHLSSILLLTWWRTNSFILSTCVLWQIRSG